MLCLNHENGYFCSYALVKRRFYCYRPKRRKTLFSYNGETYEFFMQLVAFGFECRDMLQLSYGPQLRFLNCCFHQDAKLLQGVCLCVLGLDHS